MCTDESPAGQFSAALHDFEPAAEILLEPVDSVVVTTLMDNITDTTVPSQGPARRLGWHSVPRRSSAVMEDGRVPDALLAERDRYAAAKRQAASEANAAGEHVMQYNARKEQVIREIYRRAFVAAGLLEP